MKPFDYGGITEALKVLNAKIGKRRKDFLSGNEKSVISEIETDLSKFPGDIPTIKSLLELLQLSNEKEVFSKMTLQQIGGLYKSLSRLLKDDLSINLEYYYFLKNVLDKERSAKSHLKKYKEYVNKQIDAAMEA